MARLPAHTAPGCVPTHPTQYSAVPASNQWRQRKISKRSIWLAASAAYIPVTYPYQSAHLVRGLRPFAMTTDWVRQFRVVNSGQTSTIVSLVAAKRQAQVDSLHQAVAIGMRCKPWFGRFARTCASHILCSSCIGRAMLFARQLVLIRQAQD